MRQSLGGGGALGRVPVQQLLQQVQGGRGGFGVETVVVWMCAGVVFVRIRKCLNGAEREVRGRTETLPELRGNYIRAG